MFKKFLAPISFQAMFYFMSSPAVCVGLTCKSSREILHQFAINSFQATKLLGR